MTHLTRVALLQALKRAFGEDIFNITGVDKACAIVGRPSYANNLEWHTLQALHCTKWTEIDHQAKVELCELVAHVLGIDVTADYALRSARRRLHPIQSPQRLTYWIPTGDPDHATHHQAHSTARRSRAWT